MGFSLIVGEGWGLASLWGGGGSLIVGGGGGGVSLIVGGGRLASLWGGLASLWGLGLGEIGTSTLCL